MVSYGFKEVEVSEISPNQPYCFRYQLSDPFLQESIRQHGVLTPLIVTRDPKMILISGHKRFMAACANHMKTLPVLELQTEFKPRDHFMLSLISNWKQNFSELDRSRALGAAQRQFEFSDEEILQTIMPVLALPADYALYRIYRDIGQLSASLLEMIHSGRLPFRGAQSLIRFSDKEQDILAKKVVSKAKLTTNQVLQVGEWLSDILKAKRQGLQELLKEKEFSQLLDHPNMDPRIKADQFFDLVRERRFPRLSQKRKHFEEVSRDILADSKDIRLEIPDSFENEGFLISARLKNSKALNEFLKHLSKHEPALNSLFDIML